MYLFLLLGYIWVKKKKHNGGFPSLQILRIKVNGRIIVNTK